MVTTKPSTDYTASCEIILCIARRELQPVHRAKLRQLLQQSLNWDYLFATAQAHGLLPLLHKHLSSVAGIIPGHFLSRLKRESVANSQTVLHLIGKQLRVYKLFNEHGIPVVLFKGPLLAQMAYGEISLRQAGDIDLLINRQHFDHARSLLESLGYAMYPQLTESQLASHLNNHCEIQFMRDDWFTVVDLHWNLAPRSFVFRVEVDEVMSRLQQVDLAGTVVETFSAEDSVLYQSMHGAKHLWRRFEWITALAETVHSSPEIDWEALLGRAAGAHATRMLGLGMRLVEQFSDVPISSQVLATLDANGSMQRMSQNIGEKLFTTLGAADSSETNLYNLRIMDRKRDALISTLRAIFVPTLPDWQALALPAPLHSLYYALRPLRLSKIYSGLLWQRFTRPH
ncbi:MAG TPA: nucleotidyltransferase family protein [Pyrinomonadaceae bacterium]|nr:nucleotidyltransferase family protein [Pyrinomonadaceae bacterium]